MTWKKHGILFAPEGQHPWMQSHASLPVTLPLGGDRVRVFFASRDDRNRSHVSAVEVDLATREVLALASEPVLAPGPLGHFDDHGVYPASLVAFGDLLYLYYIGWNPGVRAPLFYSSIGLAVSEDGGRSFRKLQPSPIMARSPHDPCLVTSPCVRLEGGLWRMWYVSGFRWEEAPDGLHSYYHIKVAESENGIDWRREGRVAIDLRPGERNIARPCVLETDQGYRMWYSYNQGEGYRVGMADSPDGLEWRRRDDQVGLALSAEGWDAQAQAYPWVFAHDGRLHMLYNGNGFGREGFGLAVEEG